jgi:hypothetical protein
VSERKNNRFRLTPAAAEFVDAAKVQTDAHSIAQHSTEPLHPWQDLSAGKKSINFTFTPELYAMATWCKNSVPGGISYLEILRRGCDVVCRDLIEKHYKPGDE